MAHLPSRIDETSGLEKVVDRLGFPIEGEGLWRGRRHSNENNLTNDLGGKMGRDGGHGSLRRLGRRSMVRFLKWIYSIQERGIHRSLGWRGLGEKGRGKEEDGCRKEGSVELRFHRLLCWARSFVTSDFNSRSNLPASSSVFCPCWPSSLLKLVSSSDQRRSYEGEPIVRRRSRRLQAASSSFEAEMLCW